LRVLEKLQFVRAGKISPDTERGDLLWLTRQLKIGRVKLPGIAEWSTRVRPTPSGIAR
jgi:hypothetical protein